MLPTATIVFREFLEIALVVGIVLAATRGMSGQLRMVAAGIGLGFLGSGIIALFTNEISAAVDGVGQEIFNATIMFIAVGFLSWTVIWMKKHGREMAMNIKSAGEDIVRGDKSMLVLVGAIALATLREGSEIVLFSYGMLASHAFSITSIIAGALIGAAGGIVIGAMLYMGLLKAAQKHLFTITSWMLIVLTAGIAAQGANFLIAAGLLPEIIPQVWDTSAFIDGSSFIGQTLGVLVGYTPRPTGMELIVYLAVVLCVGAAYKLSGNAMGKPAQQKKAAHVHHAVAAE